MIQHVCTDTSEPLGITTVAQLSEQLRENKSSPTSCTLGSKPASASLESCVSRSLVLFGILFLSCSFAIKIDDRLVFFHIRDVEIDFDVPIISPHHLSQCQEISDFRERERMVESHSVDEVDSRAVLCKSWRRLK